MFPSYFTKSYFAGSYFPPVVTVVTRHLYSGEQKTHTYIDPTDVELEAIKTQLIREDNEIIAIITAMISTGEPPWEV